MPARRSAFSILRTPAPPILVVCGLLAGLLAAYSSAAAADAGDQQPEASFIVFLNGQWVGTEVVAVDAGPTERIISGTSRLGPPFNVELKKGAIRYTAAWAPIDATLEGSLRGQPSAVYTRFADGTATSEASHGPETTTISHPVAADTIVLSNIFFGSYEALAARAAPARPGTILRAYVLGQVEIPVEVTRVSEERIRLPDRTIDARRIELAFDQPAGTLTVVIVADAGGRLLRLQVPAQGLEVIRSDVGSVVARREVISHPGDEQVSIPAAGFNLAGTLTKPVAVDPLGAATGRRPARRPAVVLVGGSGKIDRDETVAGIPILGQIAGALADAGFVTLRYDKRGVGQSGGRDEVATLQDYAEDLRAVVRYLAQRRDVDPKQIAVAGHSEGAWVALLAAAKERRRIAAVVLLSAPGTAGADLVLEQQRHLLERSKDSEEAKHQKIDLQRRIHQAVLTGKGWEEIPETLRRQADNAWFKSFLAFDPARVLKDVRQPLLIIHGALDRQVPVHHAKRLRDLAAARRDARGEAALVTLPELNHLLVPAKTGEVDEYATLPERRVDMAVGMNIDAWLKQTLQAQAAR